MSQRDMAATKALLMAWDKSTNPIFLSAAGQLRQALRQDGRADVAATDLVIPTRFAAEAGDDQ